MMNMILSVIVCFAMIFSGTGELPAVPETQSTWTIRNLTIDNGEESVTLTPEARLTAAMGAQEAALHFELGVGDQTIMPACGKISQDGVQFMLGESGRSYSISEDTLIEMAGMDAEDVEMLGIFGDFFLNYGAVLNKTMNDPAFYAEFNEAAMKALLETCATIEETETEIDGETYPAQAIRLEMTPAATMEMMDMLRACGIAEVEALFDGCLKLAGAADGEEYTSFADMAADMDEDMMIPMDMIFVQQDDFLYESAVMEVTEPYSDTVINMNVEAVMRGEESSMIMTMASGDDSSAMIFEMQADVTGPAEAPTAVSLNYSLYNGYEYFYPAEYEGEEDYTSASETSMFFTLEGENMDSLKDMQISALVESSSRSGYGDDLYSYEDSFVLDASCTESLEEDGSVTAAWSFTTTVDDTPWTLSFDVNRTEGAYADHFADVTDNALTVEAFEGSVDENGEAVTSPEMTMLGVDAMTYAAQAYSLMADESVMELVNMFTAVAEEEEYTEEYIEEYESGDDGMASVSSFEEAAEIFEGATPDFTAPEGYALNEIIVDSYTLTADYTGEAGSFSLVTYESYGSEGISYHILSGGELAPADGEVVEIYEYDGLVESASIYRLDGTIYFYFYDTDMAEAEAILAGLK